MFFRKRRNDIDEIKEAMDKPLEETYMPKEPVMAPPRPVRRPELLPLPYRQEMETRQAPNHSHHTGTMPPHPFSPQTRMPGQPDAQSSAPLFVKVEKYREILITLQEMKLFVSGVKQLFTLLHELETVRNDAINIMRSTVQRLEKSMVEVDQELLRPRGINMGEMSGGAEVSHIEDTLVELQRQLSELRKELHTVQ